MLAVALRNQISSIANICYSPSPFCKKGKIWFSANARLHYFLIISRDNCWLLWCHTIIYMWAVFHKQNSRKLKECKYFPMSVNSLTLFSLLSHALLRQTVIDLIHHWVRLHYAVLADKSIAKQLFSFPLSPVRGCVSKRRARLPDQISLFIFEAFRTNYTL